jgi:enoyl-CoA hydratase / 3-hydroxyacyl-CoA dehydrogenase
VRKVTIIGAGTMGHGIAELGIMNGCNVTLTDLKDEILKAATDRIRSSLEELRAAGRTHEDVTTTLSRLSTTTSLEEGSKEADFVIEAVPEVLELKREVFTKLEGVVSRDVVLATNTSSLPISEIAIVTDGPERVIGMHYFNPVRLPLIEVVRGDKTSDECNTVTCDLATHWGMEPVMVRRDVTGFIVNRIQGRMYNIACWMVSTGLATMPQVDATLKYKLGFPLGAFELADHSGIDVIHYMLKVMKDRGFAIHICPLFEEKVKAGELGTKSGRGFYSYRTSGDMPSLTPSMAEADPLVLFSPMINEAAWLVSHGVANIDDIDKAFVVGLGFRRGLSDIAGDFGVDRITERLEWLENKTGWSEFKPDAYLSSLVDGPR